VEDANVVKPTVTTGSKSGTPATEPGVGDGIGLDATQGAAKLETPAAPGLGAAVSDTSTDNVPEGSQSAALRAQMAEWRADETAAKEARIAAAAAQAAAKLEEANIAETAPATAFDELEYNKKVRERSDILDRDTILENDNILYRPERAYRFIGKLGYADFLKNGIIRAAQNTKKGYQDAYFMKGKSSGRYGRSDSGAYIVETTPVEGAWRNDARSVYITPNSPLTKDDKIRIYKRKEDGSYEVVLDNIGDRALLPAQAAAKLEGSQSAALLTPAAEELLAAAVLGAPSSITNNMRRIATENGIEILPTDTPTMVIDKLKAKKQAVESLTAASLAEEEFDFNARFDESLTAARLAEEEFDFNAGLDAARLAEEEFGFDEGFAGLDAARRAEKVAADLDAEVAAQAAAELKDAQLPSIDEGLPETPVSTSEQARVQRTATKAKIEENQAEREATRLAQNQQAAQQAEALRTENAAQYRQGDLPLSLVPAEYTPRTGALGMGKEAPEGAARQVIPAAITVSQAPITPEKQVEPVTEKLWKEMGFSNNTSKLFSNIVNGVEQGLKGKPVNDPEVRSRLSKYAYSSEKPNPQQIKVGEWLQKNKVRMQGAPDVRSSAGQAMISQIEATSRGKLDADNLAAQREKDDLFNPEFAQLSVEDPYLNDVSTPSDKQKATAVAYRKFEGETRRDSYLSAC
jgi:hypothetical protein